MFCLWSLSLLYFVEYLLKKKKLVEHDELGRSSTGHSWVVFTRAALEGTVLALKRNGKKHAKGMPADVIFGIVLSA